MEFAVVGTEGRLSDSQIALRGKYPESRIAQVKAREILPDLIFAKNPETQRNNALMGCKEVEHV